MVVYKFLEKDKPFLKCFLLNSTPKEEIFLFKNSQQGEKIFLIKIDSKYSEKALFTLLRFRILSITLKH